MSSSAEVTISSYNSAEVTNADASCDASYDQSNMSTSVEVTISLEDTISTLSIDTSHDRSAEVTISLEDMKSALSTNTSHNTSYDPSTGINLSIA